jgi:hypothetical protein
MNIRTIAFLLCLSPSAVFACEPGEKLVFSCPTSTRMHVEVCQAATAIHYTYGKPGKPTELKLSEKNETFVWEHGEGVSAGIADDLLFKNGNTTYLISHVSNFDDRSNVNAHMTVMQRGKDNISIECVAKKISFNPAAIKARQREMSEGVPSF